MKKRSSRDKGRLVERIAAKLHEAKGVHVECNVFLPSHGAADEKREIDVLLTSNIAGYPVRVAIECKNEAKPIGVEYIDAFVGKLQDIRIPVQHGIYISASGYTKNAKSRAKKEDIRLLTLNGLTADRLSTLLIKALQTTLYLLLEFRSFSVDTIPFVASSIEMLIFRNEAGEICGSLPDLIWQAWLKEEIPFEIGEREFDLRIPDGWLQIVDGIENPILSVKAMVRVVGLVVESLGQGSQYLLFDAMDNTLTKGKIDIEFQHDEAMLPLKVLDKKEQFEEIVRKRAEAIHVVRTIALPRLRFGGVFWPPSERAARKVAQLMTDFFEGRIPDPRPLDLADIEGSVSAIWEPIMRSHPFRPQMDR